MAGDLDHQVAFQHPSLHGYLQFLLSPFFCFLLFIFFEVPVFVLNPAPFIPHCVHTYGSKVSYHFKTFKKPAIRTNGMPISLSLPLWVKHLFYTSSIWQHTSFHRRFIQLCPNNFLNAFSLFPSESIELRIVVGSGSRFRRVFPLCLVFIHRDEVDTRSGSYWKETGVPHGHDMGKEEMCVTHKLTESVLACVVLGKPGINL